MVYYFRRDKGARYQPVHRCYRGPARVIAIEPSTCRNATSVVWLSHGGNLIRGAPEHLRYATDLERATYESKNGFLDITQDLRRGQGRQFEDLGETPTTAERQFAEGDQGDDVLREPEGEPMVFGPAPPPNPPARIQNRTKRNNRRSAHVDPMNGGRSNPPEKREPRLLQPLLEK